MTDCKDFQVFQPIGILKGWSSTLDNSLWDLVIVILAKRSDYIVSGRDRNLSKDIRMTYLERAHELELYAACIAFLVIQINPTVWKQNKVSLAEMFIRHDIEIPSWLEK